MAVTSVKTRKKIPISVGDAALVVIPTWPGMLEGAEYEVIERDGVRHICISKLGNLPSGPDKDFHDSHEGLENRWSASR